MLFLTDWVSTDSGPVLNSSSSWRANSSGVSSDLGLMIDLLGNIYVIKNKSNRFVVTAIEVRFCIVSDNG